MTHNIRSLRQIPLLVFLCVLLFTTAGVAPNGFAQDAAPELELPDNTGQLRKLSEYRGHVVVVNFWATWCGPCAGEMPRFVKTQQRYAPQGVTVVAVSLDFDQTKRNIPKFVEKYKMTFPVLVGGTVDHLHAFGMGDGLPGTIFIDKDGNVFGRILGEAKEKDIYARVDWLLGVRNGSDPKPPKPQLGKPIKAK
jgi:thiol-disulfide isomerase/thioredoxin